MKYILKFFIYLFVIWSCFLPPIALAEELQVVGWLQEVDGDLGNITLIRGNTRVPVAFFMELHEGDKLIIDKSDTIIGVGLAENNMVTITSNQSPYVMRRIGKPPSIARNLMKWAGNWITGLYKESERGDVVQLVTRAPTLPIKAPVLMADPLYVIGTHAGLCVAWQGGSPPFTVTVKAGGDRAESFKEKGVQDRRTCISADLIAGKGYELTIQDVGGNLFETELVALAPDALPDEPLELKSSVLPDQSKATLYATWLLSRGKGQWILTAYQQVASVADDYLPARLVRDALERGEISEVATDIE